MAQNRDKAAALEAINYKLSEIERIANQMNEWEEEGNPFTLFSQIRPVIYACNHLVNDTGLLVEHLFSREEANDFKRFVSSYDASTALGTWSQMLLELVQLFPISRDLIKALYKLIATGIKLQQYRDKIQATWSGEQPDAYNLWYNDGPNSGIQSSGNKNINRIDW